MFATQIIYETGQLISVDLNLRRYFHSFWNVLDCFSYVCICIWVILSKNKNYSSIAFASLSLAAIPLAMQMLQYLSLYRPFGILVLVIKSMLQNFGLFVGVYLVFSFGFILCFHGILYEATPVTKHFVELLLFLFQTSIYDFDYSEFEFNHYVMNCSNINGTQLNNESSNICPHNRFDYQIFGKLVYTVFIFVSILCIYELFIARIWGSYYDTISVANEEYASTMVVNNIY